MHAMVAFAAIPILDKEFSKLKWFWIIFAFLVAFSRIYFEAHFLSDVVFGAFFGYFIGDEDNNHGYKPFDEGRAGGYSSSCQMVKSGIVPLKANWQQADRVRQKLEEVLSHTEDYDDIIGEMYGSFPFIATLDEIRASADRYFGKN